MKSRTPATSANYAALRRYLDSPPPTVITDWPEFFHPHDAPDDAEWPTPDDDSVYEALESVAPVASILGSLMAIDMVVPRVEQWAANAGERFAARVAEIRAVLARMWSATQTTDGFAEAIAAVFELADRLLDYDENADTGDDEAAEEAHLGPLVRMLDDFKDGMTESAVALAMEFLAGSDDPGNPEMGPHYARWWRRFRARLALVDVATFVLDGQGTAFAAALLGEDETADFVSDVLVDRNDRIDEGMISAIVARLADPSPAVREKAVEVLGRFPHPAAVSALQHLLATDDSVAVRKAAADAFSEMQYEIAGAEDSADSDDDFDSDDGDERPQYPRPRVATQSAVSAGAIVAALSEGLKHPNHGVRESVVRSLTNSAHPEAKPLLLAALNDRSQRVRMAALTELRQYEDGEILAAVEPFLALDKPAVVARAVAFFGREGRDDLVPKVANVLAAASRADVPINASTALVVTGALGALAGIGGPAILPALRAFAPRVTPESRSEFFQAAGATKSPDAVPLILGLLAEKLPAHNYHPALEALGELRSAAGIDALIAGTKHSSAWIRQTAVRALAKIPDDRALDALLALDLPAQLSADTADSGSDSGEFFGDDDADVWDARQAMVEGLAESDAPRAKQMLLDLFRAGDRDLREAIAEVLLQFPADADPIARQLHVAALSDEVADVRQSALWAVKSLDDAEIRAAFFACLTHADSAVRTAATAVARDRRFAGALDILRTLAETDPARQVRINARDAVAAIENANAAGE